VPTPNNDIRYGCNIALRIYHPTLASKDVIENVGFPTKIDHSVGLDRISNIGKLLEGK
jgi:hypothetical protein